MDKFILQSNMKKLATLITIGLLMFLMACGGGTSSVGGEGGGGGGGHVQTTTFAFLQGTGALTFNAMTGTFTGTAQTFSSTVVPNTENYFQSISASQDGTQAVFVLDGIYTAKADGSNVRQLTAEIDSDPQFSPDGSKIVFTRWVTSTNPGQIWAMNADGSNQHYVSSPSDERYWPSYSQDGVSIVATLDGGIAVMDASGENLRRLTTSTMDQNGGWFWDLCPAFTSDNKILFVRWQVMCEFDHVL
jgi:Tol biopolymer transport system component